jgi:hypothetical protein
LVCDVHENETKLDVHENETKLDVVPKVIFDEIYCEGYASHMLEKNFGIDKGKG